MLSTGLALSLALLVEADVSSPPPPPVQLPRSSIAAVLAHRGELGLDAAEVEQLEGRDAALQRQVGELWDRLAATSVRGRAGGGRPPGPPSGAADGKAPPMSPTAAARPEGSAGGGGHRGGGGMGGHRGGDGGGRAGNAAAGAPALQVQLDDADTAAWLAAEEALHAEHREKARAIAEAYREALADQRAAGKAGR